MYVSNLCKEQGLVLGNICKCGILTQIASACPCDKSKSTRVGLKRLQSAVLDWARVEIKQKVNKGVFCVWFEFSQLDSEHKLRIHARLVHILRAELCLWRLILGVLDSNISNELLAIKELER